MDQIMTNRLLVIFCTICSLSYSIHVRGGENVDSLYIQVKRSLPDSIDYLIYTRQPLGEKLDFRGLVIARVDSGVISRDLSIVNGQAYFSNWIKSDSLDRYMDQLLELDSSNIERLPTSGVRDISTMVNYIAIYRKSGKSFRYKITGDHNLDVLFQFKCGYPIIVFRKILDPTYQSIFVDNNKYVINYSHQLYGRTPPDVPPLDIEEYYRIYFIESYKLSVEIYYCYKRYFKHNLWYKWDAEKNTWEPTDFRRPQFYICSLLRLKPKRLKHL